VGEFLALVSAALAAGAPGTIRAQRHHLANTI
jgi:hypothetical protein